MGSSLVFIETYVTSASIHSAAAGLRVELLFVFYLIPTQGFLFFTFFTFFYSTFVCASASCADVSVFRILLA